MRRFGRVGVAGMAGGLIAAAVGLAVLAAHIGVLMMHQRVTSPVDAYWQGRLPWIPIAFWLMLVGLTTGALSGLMAGWSRSPLRVRLVMVLLALPIAFWWFWASLPPPGGVPCDPGDCVPRVPDPVALAYSLPGSLVLYLVAPALAIVALAVVRVRSNSPR